MDKETKGLLDELALANLVTIDLEDLERNDQRLLSAKSNRSTIEYYFTCTPSLPLYIMNNWSDVDLITYLDADLYFFSSPVPLFDELDGHSVGIIGHRFPPHLKHLEISGIYNVGWLSFRRDGKGVDCLNWWHDQCIEWCFDRYENGLYADQKYLDYFPNLFAGVHVIEHEGANVAPWNLAGSKYRFDYPTLFVNNDPLIFFHFHGLKHLFWRIYNPNLHGYGVCISKMPLIREHVLTPYLMALHESIGIVGQLTDVSRLSNGIRSIQGGVLHGVKWLATLVKGFLFGRFVYLERQTSLGKPNRSILES